MKKRIVGMMLTAAFAAVMSMTAMAAQGTWVEQGGRWWYDNGDGTYKQNGWHWIDGNNDGSAECYYFDETGWMLANCITPDGYTVDANGAWTENGVLQVKTVETVQAAEKKEVKARTGEFYSEFMDEYGGYVDKESKLFVSDNGNGTFHFKFEDSYSGVWKEYDAAMGEAIEVYDNWYEIDFVEIGSEWPSKIAYIESEYGYYYGWGNEHWSPFE